MMSDIERKTFLFSLRIWAEPLEDNQVEWRGKLQVLPKGEAHFFRDWPELVKHIESVIATGDYADPGASVD